jgi:hypothetical protein
MVYFEDLGTTLDMTMEELQAFMESDEHGAAHGDDVRNFEVVENSGPTMVLTYERKFDGQWKKARTRITSFAPWVRCIEELEGDFAGSRFVGVHRPHGSKVQVDLFGDIQSSTRAPDKLRELWLQILAKAHDEDLATLRKFREKK